MSRIAEVQSTRRTNDETGHGVDVKVDPGGGALSTVPHFADPGDDSLPLPGDFAALEDSAGSGAEQVTGYADVANVGKAVPGEKRTYGRDSNKTPVCEVWLKGDGTIVIANDSGSFEMAPNGAVTINGVVIDADGNISAPGEVTADGEVTAMAASPATSVTLSHHIHPTGVGPSSPATPGT